MKPVPPSFRRDAIRTWEKGEDYTPLGVMP
jgi:hypothetical protein